jgi:hypothetical protein
MNTNSYRCWRWDDSSYSIPDTGLRKTNKINFEGSPYVEFSFIRIYFIFVGLEILNLSFDPQKYIASE